MYNIADDGSGDGGIFPPGFQDWQHANPGLRYTEPAFGEALMDMYIGSGKLVPDAREKWAKAAVLFLNTASQDIQ